MRHVDALSYVCDYYIAHSMITISDVQHYLPHISPAMNANASFYGKELGSRGITSTVFRHSVLPGVCVDCNAQGHIK
jgi:hypothetical protein